MYSGFEPWMMSRFWKMASADPEDECGAFREAMATSGIRVALSHGSYLVNLASPVADFLHKSRETFRNEMERCHLLGIPYLVLALAMVAVLGKGISAVIITLAATAWL